MAQKPTFPGTPVDYGVSIQNADGTAFKDLVVAPAGGVMIGQIRAASTDGSDRVFRVYKHLGVGGPFLLGEVTIPAGAGIGTKPWVDVLEVLNAGVPMNLAPGTTLKAAALSAVLAGCTIDIVIEGGAF